MVRPSSLRHGHDGVCGKHLRRIVACLFRVPGPGLERIKSDVQGYGDKGGRGLLPYKRFNVSHFDQLVPPPKPNMGTCREFTLDRRRLRSRIFHVILQDSPMDLAYFIRNRLRQSWLSSRDRARASSQAESYIASFQTGSNRTDLHDQLERVLRLPQGHLARLADQQRREHRLKKPLETTPITSWHRRGSVTTTEEKMIAQQKTMNAPSSVRGQER